jgi:predicted aspartyl protease
VFVVECEVGNVGRKSGLIRVRGVTVDPGADCTWLPAAALVRAGVTVARRRLAFALADGRIVRRSVGYALLRAGGFQTVDEVVFADLGDVCVLGGRTLRGFGAVVDVRGARLVAAASRFGRE